MNTVSQLGSLIAPVAVGYSLDMANASSPYPYAVIATGPLASTATMLVVLLRKKPRTG